MTPPVRRIYLDHAATTPLDPEALAAMRPWLEEYGGNPSSIYHSGRIARRALDEARDTLAAALGAASPREIIFTAGGSESVNLAIKGVVWAVERGGGKGAHVVTTQIEHHAVLHAARFLERRGVRVTYVPPDEAGIVSPDAVLEAVTDETVLVSVMAANNETGTLQPIKEIGKALKGKGVLFHTDAVQAVGQIPVSVEEWGCDLLSLAAHKFYGPKGVGALYVRRGTPLEPLIHGGGQEQERRAGTENVAGVVGMAHALRSALDGMDARRARVEHLRDRLHEKLLRAIPDVRVNTHPRLRLPGHLNVSIAGVEGESVLLNLDMHGIEASSGSACTSGSLEASHVLLAMGLPRELALGSIRFSLGKGNSEDDVDRAVEVLAAIVARLRKSWKG